MKNSSQTNSQTNLDIETALKTVHMSESDLPRVDLLKLDFIIRYTKKANDILTVREKEQQIKAYETIRDYVKKERGLIK